MKLIYRIIIRIALMLTVVLGAWAVFFYIAVIDEVNDEVDDSLEDYSETIIIRALAGEELPSKNNGSNNQYYLRKVSKEYADEREDICYKDSMVYIVEKEETEPARILTTLFKDDEGQYYELTVSTPTIEKDDLKDLLLFRSSAGEGMMTLKEYVDGMAEGQDTIYYACGDTAEKIALLPQTDAVLSKGYQVLYLTDDVDEFALQMLMEYDGKKFANITKDDLNLESEDEKKAMEQKNADAKGLLDTMKEALGEEVSAVKFSGNLGSHAVCLSAEGYLSMEMEKVLSSMPGGGQGAKAQLVLEINDKHPLAEKLFALLKDDPETLKKYTKILYDQARLISGLDVQNPTALADSIVDMML